MEQKVWFITGVSRGFGKVWAEAALQRGDKVAATARKTDTLKELQDKFSYYLVSPPNGTSLKSDNLKCTQLI